MDVKIFNDKFALGKAAAALGAEKIRAAIAKKLAGEFDAVFLPLQEKLTAAAKRNSNSYWLWDGVHPTPAGHRLIADAWLEAAKPLLKD